MLSPAADDSPNDHFSYSGQGIGSIDSPYWTIASASITGPSHLARGVGCDDAAAAAVHGPWLIAVVSDGAGSAKFGVEGAAITCATLIEQLKIFLALNPRPKLQRIIEESLQITHERLMERATMLAVHPHELSATVVGVICRGSRGMIFHLGDGTALIMDSSLVPRTISNGSPKEFANETHFLSEPHWHKHLQVNAFTQAESMLLMTDGMTPFVFNATVVKETFTHPIDRYLKTCTAKIGANALMELLNERDAKRQVEDDKTILWAGRTHRQGVAL